MKVDNVLNRSDPTDAFLIKCIECELDDFPKIIPVSWPSLLDRLKELGFVVVRAEYTKHTSSMSVGLKLKSLDYLNVSFDFRARNDGSVLNEETRYNDDLTYNPHLHQLKESIKWLCVMLRTLNLIIA